MMNRQLKKRILSFTVSLTHFAYLSQCLEGGGGGGGGGRSVNLGEGIKSKKKTKKD